MNFTIAGYVVYLAITVPVTIWVASTLARNGRVFLDDVFKGDEGLASAVNQLLVVGFYLLNLGFVMLYLRGGRADGVEDVFNALSIKIGVVLLTLGLLHFFNVYVFNRLRRRSRIEQMPRGPVFPVAVNQGYPAGPYPAPGHPDAPRR